MPTLSIDKSRKQIRFENPLFVFTNHCRLQSPESSGYEIGKWLDKKDEVMDWDVELEEYVRVYCLYLTCVFHILTI